MDLKYVINFLVERQLCDGIMVNPASQNFNMPLPFYEDVLQRNPVSHITLIQADITELYDEYCHGCIYKGSYSLDGRA